jgi:hypothetical protein
LKALLLVLLLAPSLPALGQNERDGAPTSPTSKSDQGRPFTPAKKHLDELKQELDADSLALSKIPADPLIQPDPLAPIMRPVDRLADKSAQSLRLKFGVTYTFLNQYATITPDSVRHNQFSGRLDFTGAWAAYEHGSTAGSISLLVRSGANIGISQKFNLSDSLGSGLYLNCLQGGGPQEPITLNVLYWRQDFLYKRLSFYVGKIHPNEYVTLSMFNNDERTQFLNGANDGNDAVASDGTYAGGAAVEFQATRHFLYTLSPWTRRAHSREISKRSPIENTRKALSWAGPPVRLVKNTGFTVPASGGTIRRTTAVDMAAALNSIMNCPMAGRHSEDSPSVRPKGRPSKISTGSAWLAFVPSDEPDTCSVLHSITANRTFPASVTKAYLRRFIAFV